VGIFELLFLNEQVGDVCTYMLMCPMNVHDDCGLRCIDTPPQTSHTLEKDSVVGNQIKLPSPTSFSAPRELTWIDHT